jgi:methyltransferase (TIGR00027 family)
MQPDLEAEWTLYQDCVVRRAKPSRSAEVVAAERALLADQGVVDDPIAQTMLGPAVGSLYRMARRSPSSIPTLPATLAGLAARVLWHDERVVEAMDAGIDQVVVLGAGFDSRAWRMRRAGARFFELDDPATQARKIQRAPASGPVYVAADLRATSAVTALDSGGLDFRKPVILILEGVTMYLPEPDVRRVLTDLGSACALGSIVTADFYPPGDAGSVVNQRQNRVQHMARAGSGETLRLVVDRAGAVELVEASGWSVEHVIGMRDAASALLPEGHHLPVEDVNDRKTLLSAALRSTQV